jgi:hypothetical protein
MIRTAFNLWFYVVRLQHEKKFGKYLLGDSSMKTRSNSHTPIVETGVGCGPLRITGTLRDFQIG